MKNGGSLTALKLLVFIFSLFIFQLTHFNSKVFTPPSLKALTGFHSNQSLICQMSLPCPHFFPHFTLNTVQLFFSSLFFFLAVNIKALISQTVENSFIDLCWFPQSIHFFIFSCQLFPFAKYHLHLVKYLDIIKIQSFTF